jgi:hypothetical protein
MAQSTAYSMLNPARMNSQGLLQLQINSGVQGAWRPQLIFCFYACSLLEAI